MCGRVTENEQRASVDVRCTLVGDPARILLELKERGIATRYKQAISLALLSYYDEVLERDLKSMKVKKNRHEDESSET